MKTLFGIILILTLPFFIYTQQSMDTNSWQAVYATVIPEAQTVFFDNKSESHSILIKGESNHLYVEPTEEDLVLSASYLHSIKRVWQEMEIRYCDLKHGLVLKHIAGPLHLSNELPKHDFIILLQLNYMSD